MATKLSLTGITFPDTTIQTTAAAGGGLGGMQVFTSSGTFTIPSGKTVVKVTVVGGGGGAGGNPGYNNSAAGGGGGGGSAIKYLTGLTPGNTLTVTRGAGGTAGTAAGAAGGTGGTSSVASGTQTITTISATGGSGSITPNNSPGTFNGGGGGVGSAGDLNITGDSGEPSWQGFFGCCTPTFYGGTGGGSILSGSTIRDSAGNIYGAGAGGKSQAFGGGFVGGNGVVVFEY
jgi:hypothetical protein